MDPFKPRAKANKFHDELIALLRVLGWFVIETHGNTFQKGWPTMLATHKLYGIRLIHAKRPNDYHFTPDQLEVFPKLTANGAPVHVLTSATNSEYQKLFRPSNLDAFIKYSVKPKNSKSTAFTPRVKNGPEGVIQDNIIRALSKDSWIVLESHGNLYQRGWPDLMATHRNWGVKLIEVKNPTAYEFTVAQQEIFPKLIANGAPVFVLTGHTGQELRKLESTVSNYWFYIQGKRTK